MKKITLFLLISFTIFPQINYACSCILPSNFCEGIVNVDGSYYADLVLRGKITDNTSNGIEVQIEQLLHGYIGQSKLIISPSFCDFYTDPLDQGKEYIFALSQYNNSFSLIACAISYLKIEDEIILGKIAPGIESLDYSNLATLENCGEGFNLFSIKHSVSIFPNPSIDILNIKNISNNNSSENVQIEFVDMIGRQLYTFKKEEGILANEVWTIDLKNFSAGIYFLKLTANQQEEIFKIVKQ